MLLIFTIKKYNSNNTNSNTNNFTINNVINFHNKKI